MHQTENERSNKQYFEEIYDSTYSEILNYISAKCGNFHDIEDIIQDVYLDFIKYIEKNGSSNIDSAKAFLFTIAKKKLARYYKKLKRKTQNEYSFNDSLFQKDQTSGRSAFSLTEEEAVNKLTAEQIWKNIESEGEPTITIFNLKYIDNMTFAEIAKKTGLSEPQVSNKFYHTLSKIIKKIKKAEREEKLIWKLMN